MSAFLGPIHYWLYNKITIQEKMVEAILLLNQQKDYVEGLTEETKQHCGAIENSPLEDIIDESNIHGWLQEQVSIVESRLSYVVTQITKDHMERMDNILDVVYQVGEQVEQSMEQEGEFISAEKVYKALNDLLLDGMPCDRINELVEVSPEEVVYRRTRCIHEEYWIREGGLVMGYYDIRRKFIEGFLGRTIFVFEADNNGNYYIRRK